jgi:NAD(P)-dependent dehydrogenase (short-subunit alcohol dehydrogenase family)
MALRITRRAADRGREGGRSGRRVVSEQADALGGVDVLINSAGIGSTTPFLELDLAEWRHVLDADVTAPFMTAQEAARRMVVVGHGRRIINVTSVHAGSRQRACSPGDKVHTPTKSIDRRRKTDVR